MNQVILTGKVHQLRKYDKITYITLALYDPYKTNTDGRKYEYIDEIAVIGRQKDWLDKYVEKGAFIELRGRINVNRYNEQKHLEIIAQEIQFAGTPPQKAEIPPYNQITKP